MLKFSEFFSPAFKEKCLKSFQKSRLSQNCLNIFLFTQINRQTYKQNKMKNISEVEENQNVITEDWFASSPVQLDENQWEITNDYSIQVGAQQCSIDVELQRPASTIFELAQKNGNVITYALTNIEQILESSGFEIPQKMIDGKMRKQEASTTKPQQDRFNREGETKNIAKNFGKQMIKFVKTEKAIIEKILRSTCSSLTYEELKAELLQKKGNFRKIGDLRGLWVSQKRFGKEMRIISNYFLKRQAYKWIFNSRVQDFICHLKYKAVLAQQLKQPEKFLCLKSNF